MSPSAQIGTSSVDRTTTVSLLLVTLLLTRPLSTLSKVTQSSTTAANALLELDDESSASEKLFKLYARYAAAADRPHKYQDLQDTQIVLIDVKNGAGNEARKTTTQQQQKKEPPTLYQAGKSEAELPECTEKYQVCSKIDIYADPWVERYCRCKSGRTCSRSLRVDDGYTILDKTRQYKVCEPVKRLPICRYFKDVAWTVTPGQKNSSVQKMNCRCRPGSVSYMMKTQFVFFPDGSAGNVFSFACSPQSRTRCQPKQPCKLFTVQKKSHSELEEVNASPLCTCAKGYRCPRRHTDPNSVQTTYDGDEPGVSIFAGHCGPVLRHPNQPVYTLVN